ncbi:hypothetical protein [Mycobacterium riyadhense]|uniref:hypothetical protein n=1 Tax=Mycobacterium riyadhense TaxID=486698 RepID=UPI00195D3B79|nr:hypothetical protein [Mycobacterium riyadhense]
MTETADTTTTVENTVDDQLTPQAGDTAPAGSEIEAPEDGHENREAAKYRHRAKTAEAERDRLAERVTVLQRAEVERLAAAKLADGQDVWRDGAELAGLLDDNGDVDPGKVDQLITSLLDAHQHWRKLAPAAPPASTVTSDGKITGDTQPKFVDAFKPRSG